MIVVLPPPLYREGEIVEFYGHGKKLAPVVFSASFLDV